MKKRSPQKKKIEPELLEGRLMLRVREYAALTGTPEPSVYKYVTSGELPSLKIGNTIRIPVAAVLEQLGDAR